MYVETIEIGLDTAADIRARTHRMAATRQGNSVLELIHILRASLREALIKSKCSDIPIELPTDSPGCDLRSGIERIGQGFRSRRKEERKASLCRAEFVEEARREDVRPCSLAEFARTTLGGIEARHRSAIGEEVRRQALAVMNIAGREGILRGRGEIDAIVPLRVGVDLRGGRALEGSDLRVSQRLRRQESSWGRLHRDFCKPERWRLL